MEAYFYEQNVNWNRDRRGMMCSPGINSVLGENGCIEVATPPQFNKGILGVGSPDHLFTAAVSICLMPTFLPIAEKYKLDFKAFACSSRGKLEQVNGKFLMTEVILEPTVTITQEEDHGRGHRILRKSDVACLISNSIKSKITMIPVVEI
ncbi:MAG: OsmC family protein [Cyclobacteriaceae bacterium]|nr:OsmC family protein [Cyclobacteriaceae bacterium]